MSSIAPSATVPRATREAAEEMASQAQDEDRVRHERLREEIRSLEERRSRILHDLRDTAAQLNDLVPELDPTARESGLLDALEVERRR